MPSISQVKYDVRNFNDTKIDQCRIGTMHKGFVSKTNTNTWFLLELFGISNAPAAAAELFSESTLWNGYKNIDI